jgi:hypothetical protein
VIKASIAWDYPCFIIIFNALKSLCMCLFDKDSLELISYHDSYGILHWVAIASAQHKL